MVTGWEDDGGAPVVPGAVVTAFVLREDCEEVGCEEGVVEGSWEEVSCEEGGCEDDKRLAR